MFLALVFIVLGLFLLLNAMGIIVGTNFWGFVFAIIFLAIGIKMLMRRGRCPICGWGIWQGRMHDKFHEHCNCEHERKKEDQN